jgi:hypothetical protein
MEMMDMGGGQMMAMRPEWSLGYGLVIFVMWAVIDHGWQHPGQEVGEPCARDFPGISNVMLIKLGGEVGRDPRRDDYISSV